MYTEQAQRIYRKYRDLADEYRIAADCAVQGYALYDIEARLYRDYARMYAQFVTFFEAVSDDNTPIS